MPGEPLAVSVPLVAPTEIAPVNATVPPLAAVRVAESCRLTEPENVPVPLVLVPPIVLDALVTVPTLKNRASIGFAIVTPAVMSSDIAPDPPAGLCPLVPMLTKPVLVPLVVPSAPLAETSIVPL